GWDAAGEGGWIKRPPARGEPPGYKGGALRPPREGGRGPPHPLRLLGPPPRRRGGGGVDPRRGRPGGGGGGGGVAAAVGEEGGVEARLRRDQRLRKDADGRWHPDDEVLPPHRPEDSARALQGPRDRPVQELQDRPRRLAQPQTVEGLRERDRRHARPHPPP